MESILDVLKFLDIAERKTREKAFSLQNLDQKLIYHRRADKLKEARKILFVEQYAFDDYIASNEYEVPEIKYETITVSIPMES